MDGWQRLRYQLRRLLELTRCGHACLGESRTTAGHGHRLGKMKVPAADWRQQRANCGLDEATRDSQESGFDRGWLWFAVGRHRRQRLTIDTVPVGNAGNPPDVTGYGSVAYTYRISTFEITNTRVCRVSQCGGCHGYARAVPCLDGLRLAERDLPQTVRAAAIPTR